MRRLISVPALVVAAAAALLAGIAGAGPALVLTPQAWRVRVAVDPTGAVALAAAALLWLLLAALALGVLATVAARLPGVPGRAAAWMSLHITPVLLRRAVNAAVGVSLVAGAAIPGTSLAAASLTSRAVPVLAPAQVSIAPAQVSIAPAQVSIAPAQVSIAPAQVSIAPAQVSLPDPLPLLGEPDGNVRESTPATPTPTIAAATPPPTIAAATATPPPTTEPDRATPLPATGPRRATPAAAHGVTVNPGDTLWELADRSLGGHATTTEISATWPRWWAANRAVIGTDPDLLHPGQVLEPPAA